MYGVVNVTFTQRSEFKSCVSWSEKIITGGSRWMCLATKQSETTSCVCEVSQVNSESD